MIETSPATETPVSDGRVIATADEGGSSRRQRLSRWVFGDPVQRAPLSWGVFGLYALMVVVGTAVTALRVPLSTINLLWAEDGRDFLTDSYAHSYLENLLSPYAGYLHVVPRTVSELISVFVPADYAGAAFAVAASVIWSLVALAAYDFSRGHILSRVLRGGLWAMVLLLPFGSLEVVANVANSHWFLLFGLYWALAARDRGKIQILAASLLAGAAALSDPLAIVALPLVALRVLLLPRIRANVVSITFVVALILQLVAVTTSTRDVSKLIPEAWEIGASYLLRVPFGGVLGQSRGTAILLDSGYSVPMIVGAGILGLIVVGALLLIRRSAMPLIGILYSAGFAGATTWLTWNVIQPIPAEFALFHASRYPVAPTLVLLSVIVMLMDMAVRSVPQRIRPWTFLGCVLLIAAVVVYWLPDYRSPGTRALIPGISMQADLHGCPAGEVIVVDVLPAAPWSATIPCDALQD